MKTAEIIKAWKDEEYRATLGPMQLQELQENPAGDIELTDAECALVSGGGGSRGGTRSSVTLWADNSSSIAS